MGIADINEHISCFNYDRSDKAMIEVVKIVKGDAGDRKLTCNQVVFVMDGRISYLSKDFPHYEGIKGQALFLPSGSSYSYKALAHTMLAIFRVYNPVVLCKNFSLEKLYEKQKHSVQADHDPRTKSIGILEMNARMWHFLDGVNDCLVDGFNCRCWSEIKIKEFFLLLRVYYAKENIYDFLFLILSSDTAFSEQVRLHWRRFQTVNELAVFLNYTPKQFSTRFKVVFGQKPYQWMTEGRARIIYTEITSTRKQFKQIALENGFTSESSFTRFCKKEFEHTPTQIREQKADSGAIEKQMAIIDK